MRHKHKNLRIIHDVNMTNHLYNKHIRKRSLKFRIRKMMRATNFISVIFICVTIFFGLNSLIRQLGDNFTNYTANQISTILSDKWLQVKVYGDDFFEALDSNDKETYYLEDNDNPLTIRLIEYKVWEGNELVYDSLSRNIKDTFLENYNFDNLPKFITNIICIETFRNITSHDKLVGKISVRLNPIVIGVIYGMLIMFAILLLLVNSLITKILTTILSNNVTKPLFSLSQDMDKLSNDDFNSASRQKLNIKNPVHEVKLLMDSTNRIMSKMNDSATLLEAQNEELEAQKDELEAQNTTLQERSHSLKSMNAAYLNRTKKLQNLLDNIGQGFLTFGKDLIINDEYSVECEEMLKSETVPNIHGMKITDTLFKGNQQFTEELLEKIFKSDLKKRELYITLLPEELCLNGRILHIEYKLVKDELQVDLMLVIITDITENRNLEIQVNEERNILKMIVKVLLHRNEFLDVIDEYKKFATKDFSKLAENHFEEILREIHTFKGIFSQYSMENIANDLNELENQLYVNSNKHLLYGLNNKTLLKSLDKDMLIIEGYVGHEFLYKDALYTVKEEKIVEMEQKIKSLLPASEYKKIVPIIKSIRHKSVKSMLRTYPDYVIKLSERLEKSIKPFKIQGDDIYVDPIIYQKLFKTLVHIFRNNIDHGIESEDRRIELGKPQNATINCMVHDFKAGFEIIINDDGRGIDIDKIRQKANQKGLIDETAKIDNQELLNLIFIDGLSTKEKVSAISGRGVGLAAVNMAVKELGGSIKVSTNKNVGTEFRIWVPYINNPNVISVPPQEIFNSIVHVAQNYMKQLNINLDNTDCNQTQSHKINLNKISALISIKGVMNAILIVSTNTALGEALFQSFIFYDIEEDVSTENIKDVLGEITNTVLGNVLGVLEEEGIYLNIGVPALMSSNDTSIRYSESQMFCTVLENNEYSLSINLLLLDTDE